MSRRPSGRIAALRRIRDAGTSFEAEISRGSLSIFERQRILAITSSGAAAGRLPPGHHDDSTGRFRVDPDDLATDEPRTIRFHPDEEATVEEVGAVQTVERWRKILIEDRGLIGAGVVSFFTRRRVTARRLAAAEFGISETRLARRIEKANAKALKRAERLHREMLEAGDFNEGGEDPSPDDGAAAAVDEDDGDAGG